MGVVYEAQDTRLPRSVAIKFLKPSLARDGDAIKRFKREARLASSLNHPNICTILDIDEGAEQLFIAMELLHGTSLKARLLTAPLSLDEILDVAAQVAEALAAAHDNGIMHRDLTPGNIFLTTSGLVKLLDFGLANFTRLLETAPPVVISIRGAHTCSTVSWGALSWPACWLSLDSHLAAARARPQDHRCRRLPLLPLRRSPRMRDQPAATRR
jgi:serine/threonine protein kinase